MICCPLGASVTKGYLSKDNIPEIVFNTYSTDNDKGDLFILDAGGNELHKVPLPRRGAMPVPTLADVDGNGTVEIIVSLKDALTEVESVLVYTVDSSSTDNLHWPTGRGNLLRNGWYVKPTTTPNSIKNSNIKPLIYDLAQNYPNPFNPSTKIKYSIPKAENVKIEIYNTLGQKIETLLNKQMSAGHHEVEFNAQALPSSVYLYRIKAGEFQKVKKMVLLK